MAEVCDNTTTHIIAQYISLILWQFDVPIKECQVYPRLQYKILKWVVTPATTLTFHSNTSIVMAEA